MNLRPLPPEVSALPKPAPKTLNLSGTDSTQVDLKGLEMTGKDSFSSQFQLTPRPLFMEERIRISHLHSGNGIAWFDSDLMRKFPSGNYRISVISQKLQPVKPSSIFSYFCSKRSHHVLQIFFHRAKNSETLYFKKFLKSTDQRTCK